MTQPPQTPRRSDGDPQQWGNPQAQPYDPNQAQAQQPYAPNQAQAQQPYDPNQAQYGSMGPGVAQPIAPPVTRKKRRAAANVVLAIILVPILAVGGYFAWTSFQNGQALQVGKCIVISGDANDADHEEVACDDTSIHSFYVAKVSEGAFSCGEEYYEYTIETESGSSNTVNKTVCLIDEWHADTCYTQTDDVMGIAPAECPADFKVTTVTNETDAACAEGEQPITYTDPARTYCVAYPE
ncbi:MAG: hypothetical protein ACK5KO_07080 [Arachnia sp.]